MQPENVKGVEHIEDQVAIFNNVVATGFADLDEFDLKPITRDQVVSDRSVVMTLEKILRLGYGAGTFAALLPYKRGTLELEIVDQELDGWTRKPILY